MGDDGDVNGRVEGLLWYKDLGNHLYGDFSMAVIQANSSLEDRSQLESGPLTSDYLGPQGTLARVMATIELSCRYGIKFGIGHWNWGEFYRLSRCKIHFLVDVFGLC